MAVQLLKILQISLHSMGLEDIIALKRSGEWQQITSVDGDTEKREHLHTIGGIVN